MSKRIILLVIIFSGLSFNSFSQVFSHAIGAAMYKNSYTGGFGLMYSPRINFININDNVTVSIGTHLGVGLGGSYTSRSGESSGSFIIDAPLVLELNAFHACNTNNTSTFGFYVGGGLGVNKMTYVDEDDEVTSSMAGVVLNGGLRTNIINGNSLDARIGYLVDATGLGSGVFTIGVSYTFGMNLY